jgi:hypothetical protein
LWKNKSISTIFGGTPLVSVPTLAQVTTAGNTTTNAITVGAVNSNGNVVIGGASSSGAFQSYNGFYAFSFGTSASAYNPNNNYTRIHMNASITYTDNFSGNFLWRSAGASVFEVANASVNFWNTSSVIVTKHNAATGNFLIGTTTDAGYKLDVAGTIRSQGSLVILNPAFTLGGSITHTANSTLVITGGPGAGSENITFGPSNRIFINAGQTRFINGSVQMVGTLSLGNSSAIGNNMLWVTGSITASSTVGKAIGIDTTLVAAANNDVLVGLDINPTFTNGAFTGVQNLAVRIASTTSIVRIDSSVVGSFHGIEFSNSGNIDTEIKQRPSTGEFRISNGRFAGWGGFITLYTDTAERMRIRNNGNVLIGTATDAGYKLDVAGTGRFTGNLTVSTGGVGTNTFNANVNYLFANQNNVYGLVDLQNAAGQSVFFKVTGTPTTGTVFDYFWISGTTTSSTIGTTRNIFNVNPTYNLTGAFTGTMRGFYYNPTLTSMTGATHRAIETTSGDVIFNGGNVGIGLTPIYKLDVNGVVRFQSTGTSSVTHSFLFRNDNSSYGGFTIGSSGQSLSIQQASGYGYLTAAGFFIGSTNSNIWTNNGSILDIQNAAGTTTYLRVASTTGNLLIGTTTDAGYKLDVNGSARVSSLGVNGFDAVYNQKLYVNGNIRIQDGNGIGNTNTSTSEWIKFSSVNGLVFGTNSTERLRIDTTGNVGIGTTTPTDIFHIVNNTNGNKFGRISAGGSDASAAWVAQNDQVDNVVYRVFGSGVSGTQMGIALARSASLLANLGGSGKFLLGTFSNTDFVMGTGNSEKMRIVDSTGNILIATTTDLGNKLEVNGTINATAYKINNVLGYTGILNIPLNPPGMQNVDIQSGIIVNIF